MRDLLRTLKIGGSTIALLSISTLSFDDARAQQARENIRNQQLILLLEDVPAQAALARTRAEHQFRRDQRAPRESPADLEPGENARECSRKKDLTDE